MYGCRVTLPLQQEAGEGKDHVLPFYPFTAASAKQMFEVLIDNTLVVISLNAMCQQMLGSPKGIHCAVFITKLYIV